MKSDFFPFFCFVIIRFLRLIFPLYLFFVIRFSLFGALEAEN